MENGFKLWYNYVKVNSICGYDALDADIYNRSEENDRLKNIRDTLLPKLMNGKISAIR